MVVTGAAVSTMSAPDEIDDSIVYLAIAQTYCRDFIRGNCNRKDCIFEHGIIPKVCRKVFFNFCHDYQNNACFRQQCKFMHSSSEEERFFLKYGILRKAVSVCQACILGSCTSKDCSFITREQNKRMPVYGHLQMMFNRPPPMLPPPPPPPPPPIPPPMHRLSSEHVRSDDGPPEAKIRRYTFEDSSLEKQVLATSNLCPNCKTLDHKVKLLHDNISVLLKKVTDLSEKNSQLTSMNEFLLQQTSSLRSDQPCVITSRHGNSAPVSLATVSVTPVVSLAGALPTLVPAAQTPNLTLAPAASRAQLLTPAPQLLTVSTTQQLVGNSGALIVTSAGAQQLMQVSDSGTLMGGGQTVVAVTPAQLTLAQPGQQLMTNTSQTTVQQLVQQSALQPQLAAQHQSQQYAAAQQSVQHLAAAQQSAQHLVQQSAQHLAAQQSAQHLAAQHNAQHLAAAQQSAQHLAAAAQQSAQQLAAAAQQSAQQQLVHQTSTQQITISSANQTIPMANSQAQPLTFPIISQSIMPHDDCNF